LSGQSKVCRLPGRNPATLTLILIFCGSDIQPIAQANLILPHGWYPRDVGLRRDVGKNSLPLKQFADDHLSDTHYVRRC
jgi:hypothetical protein